MSAPKLVEIPLGPFISPTGPMNYPCDCDWDYGEPKDDCKKCDGTGKVTGDYTPCQRKSSKDDRIKHDQAYLIRIHDYWTAGYASEQWFGWNIGGHQLDMIEQLWMIVED